MVRRRLISVVTTSLDPPRGMEIVTMNLVRELEKLCDVDILLTGGTAQLLTGSRVRTLGSALGGPAHLLAFARLLRHRPRVEGDVVLVVGVWAAVPWLLTRRRQSAIVWDHSLSLEKIRSRRSLWIWSQLARLAYRRARVVVCVSAPHGDFVRSLVPQVPVVVIPNLLGLSSLPTFVPRGPEPSKLLTVGSFTSTKQQHLAIRALAQLSSEWTLTLVGEGPLEGELRELCRELGVEKRVRFKGRLSREAVLDEMRGSDLLLQTSAGETFGMTLFEAASVGLPVVATASEVSQIFVPGFVPGAIVEADPGSISSYIGSAWAPPGPAAYKAAADAVRVELADRTILESWLALMDELDKGHDDLPRDGRG